jgi:hypothetical protein
VSAVFPRLGPFQMAWGVTDGHISKTIRLKSLAILLLNRPLLNSRADRGGGKILHMKGRADKLRVPLKHP